MKKTFKDNVLISTTPEEKAREALQSAINALDLDTMIETVASDVMSAALNGSCENTRDILHDTSYEPVAKSIKQKLVEALIRDGAISPRVLVVGSQQHTA